MKICDDGGGTLAWYFANENFAILSWENSKVRIMVSDIKSLRVSDSVKASNALQLGIWGLLQRR